MIIQRFAFWNPGTWQIPKLYWDAFSDEQRIHAICKQLGKVIAYADYLGVNVDDIAERLKAIEEGQLDPIIIAAVEQWFEDNQPAIMAALDALNESLPISEFNAENTVKAAINGVDAKFGAGFDAENTVEDAIQALENRFPVSESDISEEYTDAIYSDIAQVEAVANENLIDEVLPAADAILRFTYDRGSTEGSRVFKQNDILYFACTCTTDAGNGDLYIYLMSTGQRLAKINVGNNDDHLNSVDYRDGKLYITGSETNPNVYVYDVTDPMNPVQEPTLSTALLAARQGIADSWFSVIKIDDGFYIAHMASGQIWKTDENIGNEELVCTCANTMQTVGIPQSVTFAEKYQKFVFVWSNRMQFFNMDGSVFKTTHFGYQYGFICTDEIEAVSFIDDDVYFNNTILPLSIPDTILDTDVVQAYIHVSTVWHYNLKTGAQMGNAVKFNGANVFATCDASADPLPMNSASYDYGKQSGWAIKFRYLQDLRALFYAAQDMNVNVQLATDFEDQVLCLYGDTYTNTAGKKISGIFINHGQHLITGLTGSYADTPLANMALKSTSAGYKTLIRQEGGSAVVDATISTAIANKNLLNTRFGVSYVVNTYPAGVLALSTWGTFIKRGSNLS